MNIFSLSIYNYSLKNTKYIFCILFSIVGAACNSPTETELQNLVGPTSTPMPSELGNQAFTFSPATYNFGNKALGTAPSSTTITITNSSAHTVYLSSINGITGAFTLTSDNCPRSPASFVANATCTASISFLPTAGMVYTTGLTMNYGISVAQNNTFSATMNFQGTGVGTLSFAGIDSVSEIYNSQLKLNWTTAAGALTYYVFRKNADTSVSLIANVAPPITSYIVSGLTPSTTYKYWVRATDALGAFDSNVNVVTTATNTTPPAPVLSGYQNYAYPLSATALGSTLSFNVDDNRTGVAADVNVTYSCFYDQSVNNSVGATSCSSLPGTVSLNASTGAFSWTPATQASIGYYEFKMTVTDNISGLSDTEYFIVNIKPNLLTTNLLACYSGNFANQTYNQTSGTTWKDNMALYDGSLSNFSFGGGTGWKGTGVIGDHYRLTFDGVDDYVDLGTLGNSSTSLSFDGWINTSQLNTNPKGTIISNADSSGKGLMVREAKGYKGRLEAIKGNKSYADEVIADSPVAYLRLGDISGEAPYDLGSAGSTWTATNISSFEAPGVLGGNDKAVQYNGSNSLIISNNNSNLDPLAWPGITHEIWFNMSVVQNSMLLGQGNENGNLAFFFVMFYANLIYMEYTDGIGVGWRGVTTPFVPVANTWYHLVSTFNFSTRAYKLYINGVNVQSTTAGFTPTTVGLANKALYVGNYGGGGIVPNGILDEAALYNYVLPAGRVTAHYNAKVNNNTCLSNRMDDSNWNYFASVYNNATNVLKLFTNSYEDCSLTTGISTIDSSTAKTSMGATLPSTGAPTAGTFLNGSVKDIRAYNSAITNAQVDSNMAAQIDQFNIPNTVAGLNLWLKADSITGINNNDPIPIWTDSSGLTRNAAQATVIKQPLYIASAQGGKPAVRFDGTNDSMHITTTANSSTIFSVVKFNSYHGSYNAIMSGTAIWSYLTTSFGTNLTWYTNPPSGWAAYNNVSAADFGTNAHIVTNRVSNTLAEAFCDGVKYLSILSASGNYPTGYLYTLGNYYNDADSRYFTGDISEVLTYSGVLTDNERRRIEGYLKAKYGL